MSWQNAPALNKGDGEIVGGHQWTREARWFQGWYGWPKLPDAADAHCIEVTAARQHNGHVALWALDSKLRLWCMTEHTPDSPTPPSNWGAWEGPAWHGAPKLRNIAAVRGAEGAILWGVDEDYRMVHTWQNVQGQWSGWSPPNWMGAPHSYELTCSGQNNNCVQLWAISLKGTLSSIAQVAPSARWETGWSDHDE